MLKPRVCFEGGRERGSVHRHHLRAPVQGARRPPSGRGAQVHARLPGRRPQSEKRPGLLQFESGARGRVSGAVHALAAARGPAHRLMSQDGAVHRRPGGRRTQKCHLGKRDEAVVTVLHLRRRVEGSLQRAGLGRKCAPRVRVRAPHPDGDGAGAGEALGQCRHCRLQRRLHAGPDAKAGAGKGWVHPRPFRGGDEACTQHLWDGTRAGELLEEVGLEAVTACPQPTSKARGAGWCGHVWRSSEGRGRGGAPGGLWTAHGLPVLHPCTPTVSRVSLACARAFALYLPRLFHGVHGARRGIGQQRGAPWPSPHLEAWHT